MITGAQQRQAFTDDQFEDVFDERGILKDGKGFRIARDGEVVRVSMTMMDGKPADAFGLDDASGVQETPLTDDAPDEPQALADAYAAAETRLTNAWRDPSPAVASEPKQPTNDEQQPPATLADAYAAYETRLTTAYKNPPAMAPIVPDSTPRSLLPPPSSMMTDERAATYQAYDERVSRQWENPL